MRTTSAVLLACLVATPAGAQEFVGFPKPTGRVNDFANLLNAARRAEMETLLGETEEQTKAEVAVVTVSSLDGMSVEDYANRLFNEWGIGQKGADNGVLVLVAPNQREMRIEVGYGLEGVLPDGLAGQIIREDFLPRFRNDDYPGGIKAGVDRVVDIVKRNHVLTPEELAQIAENAREKAPTLITTPFFSIFVGIGFYMLGVGLGSRTGFSILFGSFFGGMPLGMSLIPDVNVSRWIIFPWALLVLILGIRSGIKGSAFAIALRGQATTKKGWAMGGRSGRRSGGGSWSSGSSSSSSSSSGSSFGGGRSGGGGASGRW